MSEDCKGIFTGDLIIPQAEWLVPNWDCFALDKDF